MGELTGSKATKPADREAQFSKFRELIERIASDVFDQRGKSQKPVRIFYRLFALTSTRRAVKRGSG
jgi:hypothetical protein